MSRSTAVTAGAAAGVLGIALVVWSVIVPRSVPFVVGALLIAVAIGLGVSGARGRLSHVAVVGGAALAAIMIAVPLGIRTSVASEGVLWRTDEIDASSIVTVIDGAIYSVGWSESTQATVRRFDASDGSVEQTWSHSATRPAYLTDDGGVVFLSADTRRSPDEVPAVITAFDANGEQRWSTSFPVPEDHSAFVVAAREGHVLVSVCAAAETDGDQEADASASCQLSSVTPNGETAWQSDWAHTEQQPFRWETLSGGVLPQSTVVSDAEGSLVMLSPTQHEPLRTLEPDDVGAGGPMFYDGQLIAMSRSGSSCDVTAYSLHDGAETWTSTIDCPEELGEPVMWSASGDGGPVYLGFGNFADLAVWALDGQTGESREIPLDELANRRFPGSLVSLRGAVETTAGAFLLRLDGRQLAVRPWTGGDALVETEVAGPTVLPATAGTQTLALVSYPSAESLPFWISHNPFIPRLDRDSRTRPYSVVTVIDMNGDHRELTSLFVGEKTKVRVVSPGRVLVVPEQGSAVLLEVEQG